MHHSTILRMCLFCARLEKQSPLCVSSWRVCPQQFWIWKPIRSTPFMKLYGGQMTILTVWYRRSDIIAFIWDYFVLNCSLYDYSDYWGLCDIIAEVIASQVLFVSIQVFPWRDFGAVYTIMHFSASILALTRCWWVQVGFMIQAEGDPQRRDEYLQKLMELPNQVSLEDGCHQWVFIIVQDP